MALGSVQWGAVPLWGLFGGGANPSGKDSTPGQTASRRPHPLIPSLSLVSQHTELGDTNVQTTASTELYASPTKEPEVPVGLAAYLSYGSDGHLVTAP